MKKHKQTIFLIALSVVVLAAFGLAGWLLARKVPADTSVQGPAPTDSATEGREDLGDTVSYGGKKWTRNTALKTILFMGVDSSEKVVANEYIGNGGRADSIFLLIQNTQTEEAKLLKISRDSMMMVDVYNENRELLYSGVMQINMQYAYGETPERSCRLMKEKISDLLYGVPVDSYCSLTLDGLSAAVGAMGGITVTMEEDWTEIDPAYTKGAAVHMDQAQAERFVRYRDINELGSNDRRMERHEWLLRQVLAQLKAGGSGLFETVLNAAGDYLETDMDADTMLRLIRTPLDPVSFKVPGQTLAGERHDEYHIDEQALQGLILELFYLPVQ